MSEQTYTVTVNGIARLTFTADLAEASAPITWDDNEICPFETADARHNKFEAASLLNRWLRNEGGEAWGEDEEIEIS